MLATLLIAYLTMSALVTLVLATLLGRTRKQVERDLRVVSDCVPETAPSDHDDFEKAA